MPFKIVRNDLIKMQIDAIVNTQIRNRSILLVQILLFTKRPVKRNFWQNVRKLDI